MELNTDIGGEGHALSRRIGKAVGAKRCQALGAFDEAGDRHDLIALASSLAAHRLS